MWLASRPSTGRRPPTCGYRERQLTTAVSASVCVGRLKGSPDECSGNRSESAVDSERRNGATLEDCACGGVRSSAISRQWRKETYLGRVEYEDLDPPSAALLEHVALGGTLHGADHDEPAPLEIQRELTRGAVGTEDEDGLLAHLGLRRARHAQRAVRPGQACNGHELLERSQERHDRAREGGWEEVVRPAGEGARSEERGEVRVHVELQAHADRLRWGRWRRGDGRPRGGKLWDRRERAALGDLAVDILERRVEGVRQLVEVRRVGARDRSPHGVQRFKQAVDRRRRPRSGHSVLAGSS